jgi:hypothetical protein
MTRRWQPSSQGWKTFLRNHADGMAAAKLITTPIRRVRSPCCARAANIVALAHHLRNQKRAEGGDVGMKPPT